MASARPFLTARWSNLALITYAIPAEAIEPYLPEGCVADTRDGQAFASLVAFDFLDTRVMGIRWPGFVNFPEVNLRLYVRQGERRGVVFVREFVPQRFVAFMARAIYNEPYRAVPMSSRTVDTPDRLTIEHTLTFAGKVNRLRVEGQKPLYRPTADSAETFFKEHSWGFGRSRSGRTIVYEVRHPEWDVVADPLVELDWDWAAVYGEQWAFLADLIPAFVVLAVGSAVSVFPKGSVDSTKTPEAQRAS